MNKEAYRLLQLLQLPSVERMQVSDAVARTDGRRLYLRYTGSARHQAGPVTHQELRERLEELKRDEDSGLLAGVELSYAIDLGGALLLYKDERYAECVAGNPEALLRRGLCGARFVWRRRCNESRLRRSVVSTFQGWSLEQGQDGLRWQQFLKLARSDKFWVAEKVESLKLPCPDVPILLEWFRGDNELIFCDARYVPGLAMWETKVKCVMEMREAMEQLGGSQVRPVQIDWFDVDALEPHAGALIAQNGALLSHFVTRHFSGFHGLAVVLSRG